MSTLGANPIKSSQWKVRSNNNSFYLHSTLLVYVIKVIVILQFLAKGNNVFLFLLFLLCCNWTCVILLLTFSDKLFKIFNICKLRDALAVQVSWDKYEKLIWSFVLQSSKPTFTYYLVLSTGNISYSSTSSSVICLQSYTYNIANTVYNGLYQTVFKKKNHDWHWIYRCLTSCLSI